jgi:hypothetical protein
MIYTMSKKEKYTFLHEINQKKIDGDKIEVHEENIIKGSRGLSFKYYHKDNNQKVKIQGRQNDDGTWDLITIMDDKREEKKKLSKNDLMKEIEKYKYLKFVSDYLKTQKAGRRSTRKSSSKKTLKSSRKGSRRRSRRVSRRGSKRRSIRGSRKLSRPNLKRNSRRF